MTRPTRRTLEKRVDDLTESSEGHIPKGLAGLGWVPGRPPTLTAGEKRALDRANDVEPATLIDQ